MFTKISAVLITLAVLTIPALASAHVTVKPAQVGVGAFQTFTTGVPNEKEVAVTGLRLVLPAGLHYVSPNVKPGWTIDTKQTGSGEDATVTEISWTGGTIPAGQRDDFLFSAQTPAQATELHWKAYQTYQDGTIVSWDQTPSGKDVESETTGPYSVTKVTNDLAAAATPTTSVKSSATLPLVLSVIALVVSVAGFAKR